LKIVIDTNVLISGIFFSGPPYEILCKWWEGKLDILITKKILEEYKRVGIKLSDKFPGLDIIGILDLIERKSEIIEIRIKVSNVCSDPDDDKFIECAINGDCKFIISGDKHILSVSGYNEIHVLKPRDFVDKYLK